MPHTEQVYLNHLQITNLSTQFIGPINLDIPGGRCTVLSGVSGSGKTLFLRAIADLDPHEGEIRLDDKACNDLEPTAWRQHVGLLASESQWWGNLVKDHFSQEEKRFLEPLGFSQDVMAWTVARLSSGERQRLALARLLSNHPKVLLLDEPTANLDPESTQKVESLIKEYSEQAGATVLWVSHHQDQIQRIADQHFSMANGQLQQVEA
jgi:ABC-type sugar transport system ATPase subunit